MEIDIFYCSTYSISLISENINGIGLIIKYGYYTVWIFCCCVYYVVKNYILNRFVYP